MFRHYRVKRTSGQALVEFALAATLIFTLLSAAIDLGMIFFTLQGLRTAAQEGATFGSYPVMNMNGNSIQSVDLNYTEIVNRVRFSGGDALSDDGNPTGFANLLDLDNNGTDDSTEGLINPRNASSYIYVENLKYFNDDLTATPTTCLTSTARRDMRNAGKYCYVRVTVSYEYRFFFPLAPAFGDTVRLRASYMMQVRSSFIG